MVLAPGGPPVPQIVPNGNYVDSFSVNTSDKGGPLEFLFSVDRTSLGVPGTAVAAEAGFNQQPGDIYTSTAHYLAPGFFVGALGVAPYAGPLPAYIGGGASNVLTIDDSALGLLAGVASIPPGVPALPIGLGTHDNVDAFDPWFIDTNGDGLSDSWSYFTIYPDEAILAGFLSAADIFVVAPGTPGAAPVPFAPAFSMGLDSVGGPNTDSIDALVMFDNGTPGPVNEGGVEPGIDYALFSLSPGSTSLVAFGLNSSDVFFTDFTNAFALYAPSASLGLIGVPGGEPLVGDNIDALEIQPIPEPTSLLLLGLGLAGLAGYGWKRRKKK
jgi:hypothetical protein